MRIALEILFILVLIAINGVFVGAEFALIGVRRSRLEQLAAEGNRTAEWVYHAIDDPRQADKYIATSQLGVTLASLGLGMFGEPVIAQLIEGPLHVQFGLEEGLIHTISFLFSLIVITYLHVVLGEMVPKSLALHSAETAVLGLAGPMRVAERVLSWPVRGLNRIGVLLLRLLKVPVSDERHEVYSPDELELIVSESYAGGMLEEYEQMLARNIFDFSERRAVQVMTPRTQMLAVPVDVPQAAFDRLVQSSPHSRFPIYEGDVDHVIGVVHMKDYVRQELAGEPYDLRALLRQVPFVPESLPVDALFDSLRETHQQIAVVIDEHGGTLGIVTLEDLIEEVIGEVRDEFDAEEDEPLELVAPGHLVARGTVLLDDLEEYLTLEAPDYDVETIGGLALAASGAPPAEGDELMLGDVRLRVDAMDGLAVKRVSLFYPPEEAPPASH